MSKNASIKTGILAAKVAGTIIGSTLGQPQSPTTQMGNYQKTNIPQTAAQVNIGKSTPTTGGKK